MVPKPARLEVLEGLPDLGLGVHDERAVVLDVLPDRLAAEDQRLEVARVGVLPCRRPERS
jgi:hypothetical protein